MFRCGFVRISVWRFRKKMIQKLSVGPTIVIRAKGSHHAPTAPNGCTMLVFFQADGRAQKGAAKTGLGSLRAKALLNCANRP